MEVFVAMATGKLEIPSTKPETNHKPQKEKFQTATPCIKAHGVAVWDLGFSALGFVSDFVLRMSDFRMAMAANTSMAAGYWLMAIGFSPEAGYSLLP